MEIKYTEIFKLKYMLDFAGIPHKFYDRSNCYCDDIKFQIIVLNPKINERIISVIQGNGTYGEEKDLLEIQGCLTEDEEKIDSVKGYLRAEEVYSRIDNKLLSIFEEGEDNE